MAEERGPGSGMGLSIQVTVDTCGHLILGANRAAADRLGRTTLAPAKRAA